MADGYAQTTGRPVEGYDLVVLGAAIRTLLRTHHLGMTAGDATTVVTLSPVGVAIGAVLADRLGRRLLLIGSVVLFSVFTVLVPPDWSSRPCSGSVFVRAVASFMGLLLVYGLNTWLPRLMNDAGYPVPTAVTQLLYPAAVRGTALGSASGIDPWGFYFFAVGAVLAFLAALTLPARPRTATGGTTAERHGSGRFPPVPQPSVVLVALLLVLLLLASGHLGGPGAVLLPDRHPTAGRPVGHGSRSEGGAQGRAGRAEEGHGRAGDIPSRPGDDPHGDGDTLGSLGHPEARQLVAATRLRHDSEGATVTAHGDRSGDRVVPRDGLHPGEPRTSRQYGHRRDGPQHSATIKRVVLHSRPTPAGAVSFGRPGQRWVVAVDVVTEIANVRDPAAPKGLLEGADADRRQGVRPATP
ncbi:hypothetical protein [Streptomyces sp. NPDC046727]|uniref:hypothetical protein n=1 Tax=Streptomyces sp. NPDC046727 TaxID=3155373 RepID=UPI0033C49CCC